MKEITEKLLLAKVIEKSIRKMNKIEIIPDRPLKQNEFDDLEWELIEYIRQLHEPVYLFNSKPQMTSKGKGVVLTDKSRLKDYYALLLAGKGLLKQMGIFPKMLPNFPRDMVEEILERK